MSGHRGTSFNFFVEESSVFCDITPCNQVNAYRRFRGTFCHLLHLDYFLGLFFDPEDEGNMLTEISAEFQRATRRCIPEHSKFFENIKSYK
jgi:hypothetical protein